MTSPSPICTVKDGAGSPQPTTAGYAAVTPGNTVTIALADATGVDTWSISCIYADETTDPAAITSSLAINASTKTATFTAPIAGKALVFQSRVNNGIFNGVAQSSYTTTFKVATATPTGLIVAAANETYEHSSIYGWTQVLNTAPRTYSFGVHSPVKVVSTSALATNTRSGNTLTASDNGALSAVDGISLSVADRILVAGESTGANNGIYDVVSLGDGSNHWVLTRSTDADTSAKMPAGTLIPVSQGNSGGGKVYMLTTAAPITLNTTSLVFSIPSLGGGWTTDLDLDFTIQNNQNLKTGGDGTKTIGGYNFTIGNTATLTSGDVVNGTGIVLVLNTGTAGPYFEGIIDTMLPSLATYNDADELEISWQVSVSAQSVSNEALIVKWGNSGVQDRISGGTIYSSGSKKFFRYAEPPGSTVTWPVNSSSTNSSDDAYVLKIKNATLGESWTGLYSSGWPRAMNLRGWHQLNSTTQTDTWIARTGQQFTGIEYSIPSSCNGRTITVKRIRIRHK